MRDLWQLDRILFSGRSWGVGLARYRIGRHFRSPPFEANGVAGSNGVAGIFG
jgi:hypothetical protein